MKTSRPKPTSTRRGKAGGRGRELRATSSSTARQRSRSGLTPLVNSSSPRLAARDPAAVSRSPKPAREAGGGVRRTGICHTPPLPPRMAGEPAPDGAHLGPGAKGALAGTPRRRETEQPGPRPGGEDHGPAGADAAREGGPDAAPGPRRP